MSVQFTAIRCFRHVPNHIVRWMPTPACRLVLAPPIESLGRSPAPGGLSPRADNTERNVCRIVRNAEAESGRRVELLTIPQDRPHRP